MSNNIPEAFRKNLKVTNPFLLRGGFPTYYQNINITDYDFFFKTLRFKKKDNLELISANKQISLYNKLKTVLIKKPLILGLGSYPTDKGAMALAANIISHIKKNNKAFNLLTFSALLVTPNMLLKYQEYNPEIICITGLCDDNDPLLSYSIENGRALIEMFKNSIIIIPVASENIVNFFKFKLHKDGLYLQFSYLKNMLKV